jgi:hypothetical protein
LRPPTTTADVVTGLRIPRHLVQRESVEPNNFFPSQVVGGAATHSSMILVAVSGGARQPLAPRIGGTFLGYSMCSSAPIVHAVGAVFICASSGSCVIFAAIRRASSTATAHCSASDLGPNLPRGVPGDKIHDPRSDRARAVVRRHSSYGRRDEGKGRVRIT